MLRPVWKKCLLLAALMVAGVTLSASPAQAGWWHWRTGWYGAYSYGYYPSSYGCYPSYVYTTSYCSPAVTRCGWSWYRPAWYSGCYTGWYAGCYNPCYRSCCGGGYDVVTSGCGEVVVEPMDEAGMVPMPAPPVPKEPAVNEPEREPASLLPIPPEPKSVPAAPDVDLPRLPDMPALPPAPGDVGRPNAHRNVRAGAAMLTVVVPQDAQVYVNGLLTKTPGVERQYVSHGLQPGYSYTYEVRAVVIRNGQSLSDTQVVRIRVGDERDLAFDFDARSDEALAARLR
jgi:uncharacterized protein (TIGR03000 family)